ncbi:MULTISPECIES: hypothetical protein [unclassified Mesorhizobium]|uniref:hypothetical protein n=1 Tax=unclassified Mesorhizobium TaxID=325217 RepID=UPI0033383CDD
MTMRPSGNFGNGMFDAAGELGDPDNEAFENSGDDAGEFTLGLGLGFGGCCAGSGAQPAEHIGDAAPAAILVLGEEGGHALLGQAAGALPRRVALDEPRAIGLAMSANRLAAPGQKLSSRARCWLASTSLLARDRRGRAPAAGRALMASDCGLSGASRWPSVRRMSARMQARM